MFQKCNISIHGGYAIPIAVETQKGEVEDMQQQKSQIDIAFEINTLHVLDIGYFMFYICFTVLKTAARNCSENSSTASASLNHISCVRADSSGPDRAESHGNPPE